MVSHSNKAWLLVVISLLTVIAAVVCVTADFSGAPNHSGSRSRLPENASLADSPVSSLSRTAVAPASCVYQLVDAVQKQAVVSGEYVVKADGETLAGLVASEGRLILPIRFDGVPFSVRIAGYYPAKCSGGATTTIELVPQIAIPGSVEIRASIWPEDLVVMPEAVPSEEEPSVTCEPAFLSKSAQFVFKPAVLQRHILRLYSQQVVPGGPSLADTVWEPGQTSVNIVLTRGISGAEGEVAVNVVIDNNVIVALAERRRLAELSGRRLAGSFDAFAVQLIGDDGARYTLGSQQVSASSARALGRAMLPGTFYVRITCTGLSMTRVFGPYRLRKNQSEITCAIDAPGQLDVVIRGFGRSDLVNNAVSAFLTDVSGRVVQSIYASDAAESQAEVRGMALPSGRFAVWAQAAGEERVARPIVVDLANGTRPAVATDLGESTKVTISIGGGLAPPKRLFIQCPENGAKRDVSAPSGKGQSSVVLARGPWNVIAELEDGKVLEVPFMASGPTSEVAVGR